MTQPPPNGPVDYSSDTDSKMEDSDPPNRFFAQNPRDPLLNEETMRRWNRRVQNVREHNENWQKSQLPFIHRPTYFARFEVRPAGINLADMIYNEVCLQWADYQQAMQKAGVENVW